MPALMPSTVIYAYAASVCAVNARGARARVVHIRLAHAPPGPTCRGNHARASRLTRQYRVQSGPLSEMSSRAFLGRTPGNTRPGLHRRDLLSRSCVRKCFQTLLGSV